MVLPRELPREWLHFPDLEQHSPIYIPFSLGRNILNTTKYPSQVGAMTKVSTKIDAFVRELNSNILD